MADNPRLKLVRDDLKTQITDVYPSPGTIIIVHPKQETVQFNQEFSEWLAETLKDILPIGVKGMVLSENVASFNDVSPNSDDPQYVKGWHDAIKAVSELHG